MSQHPDPPSSPRFSRFAVLCFIAALFTCPCLVGSIVHGLERELQPRMPDGLIKPLLLGGPATCVLIAAIVSYSRIEKSRGRLQGGAFSVLAMMLAAIGILLVVIVAIFNRPLGNMH